MEVKQVFILVLIFTICQPIWSAKILGLFTTHCKSNLIIQTALMNELAAKGHEVTVVTTVRSPNSTSINYRDVFIPIDETHKMDDMLSKALKYAATEVNTLTTVPALVLRSCKRTIEALNHPEFKKLKTESFDLLILGWSFNDFQLGVAAHFKCPSVIISTFKVNKSLRDYVGSPSGVSHVPAALQTYKGQMTFFDRVNNFAVNFVEYIGITALNYFVYEPYYKEVFPPDQYPSLDEVRKNISLVLVNQHFSQGNVESHVPGMIEVGGMHIKGPSPLPKNFQEFLDNATHGALLFSFGTNIKTTEILPEKLNAILKVFSKLKQKIVMKWENDEMPSKPENIFISKWFQQNDILAHPNVKVFISHCGLSSINEAKYHGVPILGIPIYGDQPSNLNQIVEEGWAVSLPYADLDEHTFSKSLNEILHNSIYYETIKTTSNIYKDRPQSAMNTAVFWVEYVIRHRGAKHMQSQSVHLNVFQYHSLDVIGFIAISIYLLGKMIKCSFKYIFKNLGRRKLETKNKKE